MGIQLPCKLSVRDGAVHGDAGERLKELHG